jgi:hypothetical protein
LIVAHPIANHGRMDDPVQTRAPERRRSDFFGAFCFVVLIVTVAYAALTAQ